MTTEMTRALPIENASKGTQNPQLEQTPAAEWEIPTFEVSTLIDFEEGEDWE